MNHDVDFDHTLGHNTTHSTPLHLHLLHFTTCPRPQHNTLDTIASLYLRTSPHAQPQHNTLNTIASPSLLFTTHTLSRNTTHSIPWHLQLSTSPHRRRCYKEPAAEGERWFCCHECAARGDYSKGLVPQAEMFDRCVCVRVVPGGLMISYFLQMYVYIHCETEYV